MRIAREDTRSLFSGAASNRPTLDYQEVVNFSFVEAAWEADFCGNDAPVKLLNPIASQMSVMRSALIGSLVANVRYNLNRKHGARARVRNRRASTSATRRQSMARSPWPATHQP